MDLYQLCLNYASGAKNCPPWGHIVHIGLYRENFEKIFLSETIRPRALIFGMKHHLVSLYQVCSNYIPGAKNGPTQGSHFYIGLYTKKHEKFFSSETTSPRALIFGMKHHLVNLYQVCSNYIPGAKNGLPQGSHVLDRPI